MTWLERPGDLVIGTITIIEYFLFGYLIGTEARAAWLDRSDSDELAVHIFIIIGEIICLYCLLHLHY